MFFLIYQVKLKNWCNKHQKEDTMEDRTKTYRAPIVRVKFTAKDVITASMVKGQGNMWNDGENPWKDATGGEEE